MRYHSRNILRQCEVFFSLSLEKRDSKLSTAAGGVFQFDAELSPSTDRPTDALLSTLDRQNFRE